MLLVPVLLQKKVSHAHSSQLLWPQQLLPQDEHVRCRSAADAGDMVFSSTFSVFKSPWHTLSRCMYARARAMSRLTCSSCSCGVSEVGGQQQW